MLNANKTQLLLEEHFENCLKYWERTLNQNRDLDKECYANAINDILNIKYDPGCPFPTEENRLDEETVRQFIKYREMDLGKR